MLDLTNGAQLHVIVNHIAIIGVPVAALALAWGLARRQPDVIRLALGLMVLLGASVGLAVWTGEAAEDVVEAYGVSEDYIDAHEDFATLTAWITGLLALFALGALVLMRREIRYALGWAVLVASVPVGGMLGWTGHLGGEIRHPELRPGAAATGDGFFESDDDERDERRRERERDDD